MTTWRTEATPVTSNLCADWARESPQVASTRTKSSITNQEGLQSGELRLRQSGVDPSPGIRSPTTDEQVPGGVEVDTWLVLIVSH